MNILLSTPGENCLGSKKECKQRKENKPNMKTFQKAARHVKCFPKCVWHKFVVWKKTFTNRNKITDTINTGDGWNKVHRGFIFPDRALLISIHSITACCKCDFVLEDKNFSLKVTAALTNNTRYKFILKCVYLFVSKDLCVESGVSMWLCVVNTLL